jgi:Tfp pilus assembly protein PilN
MSTVNLLPQDFLRNRARKRANTLCLILFAVVIAGVVAAGMVTDQSGRTTREVCEQVNRSYAEAAKLIEQVHELQDQKALLTSKAEHAAALQERVPRSYILGALANACPERACLLSVRLDTKMLDPDKTSKFDAVASQRTGKAAPLFVDLQVTGQAGTDVDVARFITELARNPLLSNVDLVYSEARDVNKSVVREFQVKMEIQPGMDVLDVIGQTKEKSGEGIPRGEGVSPLRPEGILPSVSSSSSSSSSSSAAAAAAASASPALKEKGRGAETEEARGRDPYGQADRETRGQDVRDTRGQDALATARAHNGGNP